MKKAYMNYGISLTETIYALLKLPEGDKREKGALSLFKAIMAEKFSNLGRDLDNQVHEGHSNIPTQNELLQDTLK